jgi:hypothetical protein
MSFEAEITRSLQKEGECTNRGCRGADLHERGA